MVASKVSSRDVKRLFLQAVMSRGIMSADIAVTLWKKCCDAVRAAGVEVSDDYTSEAWDDFVVKINESIDAFALEFRYVVDESSGSKLYAMVNTKGDEVAQLATDYTPLEITYFRAVVEQIMIAPNHVYSIASKAALREVTYLKSNMTKMQAEGVLTSLVKRGWLLKSKRGRYSLAARALLELDAYLRQNYEEDCSVCVFCKELVTKGKMCYKEGCNAAAHRHCFEGNRKGKSSPECRACKTSWSDAKALKPIGEDAARDGLDDKRRVRRRTRTNDSDNEDEMDESQDINASQVAPQTQSSQRPTQTQRGKGKSAGGKKSRSKKREETPESNEDDEEVEGMNIDDEEEMAEPTQTQTQRRTRNRRG